MKRVKNLTENKVLINTFKKLKTKIHLNKSGFKNYSFYLLKYNRLTPFRFKLPFSLKDSNYIFLNKTISTSTNQKKNYLNLSKSFTKTLLMFIN